jgi:hypothetical protein
MGLMKKKTPAARDGCFSRRLIPHNVPAVARAAKGPVCPAGQKNAYGLLLLIGKLFI